MRTATVRLSPPREGLHPAGAEVATHENLERDRIDEVGSLSDGTGLVLCRLRGSEAAVEAICDDAEGILEYHTEAVERTVHLHVHFELTRTAAALLALRRRHELVVTTPMRWLSDGRLEVSAVGDDRTLGAAIESLPETVGAELVEIREYRPAPDRPEALLTDRQLEVLDAALAVGYYEEPRDGTQADVARAVGLAPATAGEHLRRIEGKVLRALRA
jgi:hypothetical protein